MDKALKQRLVGASVLIALAVIVLPMLLNGRPESGSQQSQKIELPPRPDELTFETRRFPVTDPQRESRPMPDRDAVSGDRAAAATSAPVRVNEKEAAQAPPEASPKAADLTPEPVAAKSGQDKASPLQPKAKEGDVVENTTAPLPAPDQIPERTTGRYVVQVASLGSAENASRLMASLQKQGLPVLLDTIDSGAGRLNRVRVGPFESETEASQVSERIAKDVKGVRPRVVDLQPDQSESVGNPADALVRWVVQAGSFSDASNAERLVSQLREDGMSAYQETVTSSTSSIFRVRIGPFLERDEAIRTKQQLSEKLSIHGVVMTAD